MTDSAPSPKKDKKSGKKRKRQSEGENVLPEEEEVVKKICPEEAPEESEKIEEPPDFIAGISEELLEIFQAIESEPPEEDTILKGKLKELNVHFNSIISQNVDSFHSSIGGTSFPDWVKTLVLIVLKRTRKTTTELYKFLICVMKVSPTKIEDIIREILVVAVFCPYYKKKGGSVHGNYLDFLKQLLVTFEKMRRVPKMVGKMLITFRGRMSAGGGQKEALPDVQMILPQEFMDAFGESIALLPHGQVMDLWNMLNHNLKECSNPENKGKLRAFFPVVIRIYCGFLANIKIADYSVPAKVVEKASEFMKTLSNQILTPLANVALNDDFDKDAIKGYLQLSLSWAQVHGMMYNFARDKYKLETLPHLHKDPSPFNLNPILSYMEPESSTELCNKIIESEDFELLSYLVKLVAEKLKIVTMIEEKKKHKNKESSHPHLKTLSPPSDLKRETLASAAQFIWDNLSNPHLTQTESKDLILLTAGYIETTHKIKLAHSLVKGMNVDLEDSSAISSYLNSCFYHEESELHCGLILEILHKIIRTIGKVKSMPSFDKELSKEILSSENRAILVQICDDSKEEDAKKKKELFQLLLNCINSLINSSTDEITSPKFVKDELSSNDNLFKTLIEFLASQPLKDYPKDMRTTLCLSFIGVLIALAKRGDYNTNVMNRVCYIISKSGINTKGNEILFNLSWIPLFKWFTTQSTRFSDKAQSQIINLTLMNIYISPKYIEDFQKEFGALCLNLEDHLAPSSLYAMDFLNRETLQAKENKSKHLPTLKEHHKKLTRALIHSLTPYSEQKTIEDPTLGASIFHASSLLDQIFTQFPKILKKHQKFASNLINIQKLAIKFLKSKGDEKSPNSRLRAYEFLHHFYQSNATFLSEEESAKISVLKMWGIFLAKKDLGMLLEVNMDGKNGYISPQVLVQSLFEKANLQEFEEMCVSLQSELENQSSKEPLNNAEMGIALHLLNDLISVKLTPEKREINSRVILHSFYALLVSSKSWSYDENSLKNVVLPILSLQMKLLQKRNALRIQNTHWAICLNSITSVPLKSIENIGLFARAFSSSAELLNAFTMHRLDVISYRMHIYLQCFTFLVETLVSRADQDRRLCEREIFDLRSCAHSLQRCCQSMKSGKKEFSRIAPYLLASIMMQMEEHTVYPAVKGPILAACYKLLDLCDEFGVAQLNSMLAYGAREIFKTVYDIYKKFYKYKGKV